MYRRDYTQLIAKFNEDDYQDDTFKQLITIDDETLSKFLKVLRPVSVDGQGRIQYIKLVDPRNQTFTWNPEYVSEADDLEPCDKIVTYHSCGHPIFFKPSIAEVCAALDLESVKRGKIAAFSTTYVRCLRQGQGHLGETTLYRLK